MVTKVANSFRHGTIVPYLCMLDTTAPYMVIRIRDVLIECVAIINRQ